MKRLLIATLFALATLAASAQTDSIAPPPVDTEATALAMLRADTTLRTRFVTRATLYGIGYTNAYDTYLSPEEYRGGEFRIVRENIRATRYWHGRLSRMSLFQANVAYTRNRADNNTTMLALVNWTLAYHLTKPLAPGLTLDYGAAADLNGGFVYNMRNGNNPAQAKAYASIDASALLTYQFTLAQRSFSLRYAAQLPVIGLMFSPHYGQSYYEIFSVGNTSGIINFTSLHNHPSLRQMLSLDFPVGQRSTMRFAYVCDIQQSSVQQIDAHTYSHAFLIGFVRQLYRIRRK